VQAVFDVIVRSAVELTSAEFGGLQRTDGREITMAASHGVLSGSLETAESLYPMPLDKESLSGRAILSRAIQHAPDIEALPSPPSERLRSRVRPASAVSSPSRCCAAKRPSVRLPSRAGKLDHFPRHRSNSSRPSPTRP
jgi:hypothetical protein